MSARVPVPVPVPAPVSSGAVAVAVAVTIAVRGLARRCVCREACRLVLVGVLWVGELGHELALEVQKRREGLYISLVTGYGVGLGLRQVRVADDDWCGLRVVVVITFVDSVVRGVVLRRDRVEYPESKTGMSGHLSRCAL